MTIRQITDRALWEDFWQRHGPHALFQSWLWGEAVKKQFLPLVRFGLYDGSKLSGIFQVVTVRARRGTYLHVRQGPVLSRYSSGLWKAVVSQLRILAKEQKASFLRVSPPIEDSMQHRGLLRSFGMLPAAVHEVDAERRWELDITPDEDTLLGAMRKTTRYEIKRAIKEGVLVEKSHSAKDLESFFDLYRETAVRQGFVPHQGIQEEFAVFAGDDRAVIVTAAHSGKTVAAAIILFSEGQAVYHHGASVPNRVGASYLVQWEAIREAKRRGMKIYNFWGVAPLNRENHPWRGITLFKTGFGGSEQRWIHAHDLPLRPLYWLTRGIEFWERLRRGY